MFGFRGGSAAKEDRGVATTAANAISNRFDMESLLSTRADQPLLCHYGNNTVRCPQPDIRSSVL